MKLIPVADRLVIRRIGDTGVSKGGVIIPDNAQDRHKPQEAEIVAVGPGRLLDDGKLAPIDARLAPGTSILFVKYSGSEVQLDEEHLVIISERDVLAVVQGEGAVDTFTPTWHRDHGVKLPGVTTELPPKEDFKAKL